ncbi:hypothetical protein B0A49_12342 [Cryomyces minteri]|uniref:WLM domain-containing protein n=1 Tax=Cryomyces minteri TaxID=331657 RepID=A0A4U0VF80_9PEZI|nr:hypothetical protein B0A49_12342 [Cryomyces minteri]
MAAADVSSMPHSDLPSPLPSHTSDADGEITLTVQHHGKPLTYTFRHDATVSELSSTIADTLSIPTTNQKLLISPKVGLLRPPFKQPDLALRSLADKKIVLMGSTAAEVSQLDSDVRVAQSQADRRSGALRATKAQPSRNRDWQKAQDEATYTFHTLRPLPYLPQPERSLRFLERLRDDAGIKASMRSHKFSIPLLTEMNPAEHTTRESRTLGLNRNRGEVIELRLRTDAYDGYRDYKTIRKTLCHELAHNVWGEHDRNFWTLCREIEAEVERNDWRSGGHALSNQEFYNPNDGGVADEDADHGGWTGGEFVLGGGGGATRALERAGTAGDAPGLSRREILAKAAEERMRKQREAGKRDGSGSGSTAP